MDAHRILKELYYNLGINNIPELYFYIGFGTISLIYAISSCIFYEREDLIKSNVFRKKIKDLDALTSKLCEVVEDLEVASKQATFRLDMQSSEQKEIRFIVGKLKEELDKFYISD